MFVLLQLELVPTILFEISGKIGRWCLNDWLTVVFKKNKILLRTDGNRVLWNLYQAIIEQISGNSLRTPCEQVALEIIRGDSGNVYFGL